MSEARHKPSAAVTAGGSRSGTAMDVSDPMRWIWLALVSGLFFIRWWQPTEGTVLGDTLVVAEGWFLALLLAGWVGLRGTTWRFRLDAWQWAVGLLVLGHIISGLWILGTAGDRRAALNLVWEWAALGLSFPLLRAALARPETRREWIVISLAAVLTLSGYGLTQRYFFYPQLVRQYERLRQELDELEQSAATGGPVNVLRMQKLRGELIGSGLSANMLSGSGRVMFEGRLKHSTEALGRFALANTFAGLLLVWWVVLVVVTWRHWLEPRTTDQPPANASRPRRSVQLVMLLVFSAIVGYCLLLTKSRTAYVGAAVSMSVWSLTSQASRFKSGRQILLWLFVGLFGIGGVILVAGLTGGLDRLVFAEAPKSLQYRLEYWYGSLQVIRESPWLGVGPGQFRPHYLAHKLPRSSEEIADPHNLFLDVWSNGGLVSLIGLTWLTWLIIRRAVRSSSSDGLRSALAAMGAPAIPLARTVRDAGISPKEIQHVPQPKSAASPGPSFPEVSAGYLAAWRSPFRWGALTGVLVLWLAGGATESLLLGLMAIWLVAIEVVSFALPEQRDWEPVWGAVGLGLLVHLCGAGGIGMPAISQLLMAVIVLCAGDNRGLSWVLKPAHFMCITLGGIALAAAGYATAVLPVGNCRRLCDQGDFTKSPERLYLQAAAADPLSPEPWEKLGDLYGQIWRTSRDPDERVFQQAVAAERNARQRNPFSYHTYQTLGLIYAESAKRSGLADDKANAVKEMQSASSLYPHNASLLADAAVVFKLAGEIELAKQTAQRTLEQDDINHAAGHTDKWLGEKLRREIEQLVRE